MFKLSPLATRLGVITGPFVKLKVKLDDYCLNLDEVPSLLQALIPTLTRSSYLLHIMEILSKTDFVSRKKGQDFVSQSPKPSGVLKPSWFDRRQDSKQKLLDPFGGIASSSMQQCGPGISSPFTGNEEDKAYYDLEQALQYPVLPPSPHFFCCFERFHITVSFNVRT